MGPTSIEHAAHFSRLHRPWRLLPTIPGEWAAETSFPSSLPAACSTPLSPPSSSACCPSSPLTTCSALQHLFSTTPPSLSPHSLRAASGWDALCTSHVRPPDSHLLCLSLCLARAKLSLTVGRMDGQMDGQIAHLLNLRALESGRMAWHPRPSTYCLGDRGEMIIFSAPRFSQLRKKTYMVEWNAQ